MRCAGRIWVAAPASRASGGAKRRAAAQRRTAVRAERAWPSWGPQAPPRTSWVRAQRAAAREHAPSLDDPAVLLVRRDDHHRLRVDDALERRERLDDEVLEVLVGPELRLDDDIILARHEVGVADLGQARQLVRDVVRALGVDLEEDDRLDVALGVVRGEVLIL